MTLKGLKEDFTVCKVKDYSIDILKSDYCFIGKGDDENSLVCPTANVPENVTEREDGFKGFRIAGNLDFSLIGILSEISAVLANNLIGIFVVSTFNTDYVFVKKENYQKALDLLQEKGYHIINS